MLETVDGGDRRVSLRATAALKDRLSLFVT